MQNDMRDRLVELLSIIPCNAESCSTVCDGRCQEFDDLDRCQIGQLADHLIANGVIVLPYKIGSKLYRNVVGEKEPQEYTVVGFYCEEEPKLVSCEFKYNDKTYSHTYDIEDEGKYYRTTKDQAEQKLKELSENG